MNDDSGRGAAPFALCALLLGMAGLTGLWATVGARPSGIDLWLAGAMTSASDSSTWELVTILGNEATIAVLLLLMAAVGLHRRSRRMTVLATLPTILAAALTFGLKGLADRPRPMLGRLSESSPSWPSGHAALSLALALGVLLAVRQHRLHTPTPVALAVLGTAVIVGASRVALGVHWATDVVAGWLVAVVAAALAVLAEALTSAAGTPRSDVPR